MNSIQRNLFSRLACLSLVSVLIIGAAPAFATIINPLEITYTYENEAGNWWHYPDLSGDELADGYVETRVDYYHWEGWVGFIEIDYMNGDSGLPQPGIVFDLGDVRDLNQISVSYMNGGAGGVFAPDSVEIFFSYDGGLTFSSQPDVIFAGFNHPGGTPIDNSWDTSDISVNASGVTHVRMAFYQDRIIDENLTFIDNRAAWTFLSEVAFHGQTSNPDSDGDGVPDTSDICPGGDDNLDSDFDTVPDFCDPCPLDSENDADGDGACGDVDICPGGDDSINTDLDALPDFCDACPFDPENDADGDGICESDDNCPNVANDNQQDVDADGYGDACDDDDDNDGIADPDDNCPFDDNPAQSDFDGDGAGDVCDADADGDGVLDRDDACLPTTFGEVVDSTGCSLSGFCPCENSWKNHGAYVRCVAQTAEDFVAAGLLTEGEKDSAVSAAANSDCGSKKP